MADPLSAPKRSDRLRRIGWLVLACGFVAALAWYVVASRRVDPEMSDLTALGYRRSLDHQMGVMMGRFGLMLTEWQEALSTPTGEALLIATGAALFAGYFFRVAWVIDEEAREQADHLPPN